MVFLPHRFTKPMQPHLTCYCHWCARSGFAKKDPFKLVDGPIDFFFCNDECALNWLDMRLKHPKIADLFKLIPEERVHVLKGRTVAQYCAEFLEPE